MLGLGFPYSPTQVGLTLLTVGVPTLFLTMWARPTPPDPHMFATLARFVLPAGVVTAAGGVAVYAYLYTIVSQGLSRSTAPAEVIRQFEGYTGLSYADAVDPETSLVICNEPNPVQGKGYQGRQLGVPLISDAEFMTSLDNVIGGTDIEDFTDHTLDGGQMTLF